MDTAKFTRNGARKSHAFSEEQLDNLLDTLYEKNLTDGERDALLEALLPSEKRTPESLRLSADLVTPEFVQNYAGYRLVGLNSDDAARLCGISPARMRALIAGVGLSREQHELLLKAEHSATARFKFGNLSVLHNAAQNGQWKAAVALLEKVLPEEYGPRMDVRNETALHMSSTDCEAMARKAALDLDALRAARKPRTEGEDD